MATYIDLSGKKIGALTIFKRAGSAPSGEALWECQCDCGIACIKTSSSIKENHEPSCGCLKGFKISKCMVRHGRTRSPEYVSWCGMKARCLNSNEPGFHRYGGRGIQICERWKNSFENFLTDMGEKPSPSHSIDRIDVDGNYEPSNCRWATKTEQSRNQRSNRLIEYNGSMIHISVLAKQACVSRPVFCRRINNGWTVEESLRTPPNKRGTVTEAFRKSQKNRKDGNFITSCGKTLCVSAWSEMLGIKSSIIYGWARRGKAEDKINSAFLACSATIGESE